MEEHKDAQHCFHNSSCRKASLSTSIYITLYIFFSLISAVTVFLNVLVIISISHFKQLHTQTNLLILSLAVADLLVGLIAIPVVTVAIMESCWVLGKYFCEFFLFIGYFIISLSLGNLVLISIDRYVAVCDPLLYHSKITIPRMMRWISITWCCCIIYNTVIANNSVNVEVPKRSQARKVFSKEAATKSGVKIVKANKSERKAAKTLSIVVFTYLTCWISSFLLTFFWVQSSTYLRFLPFVNSLINPIIYAFCYPWFKMTAKHILTL
ncbi:trace amine-associated receptor 13c-like, partial [Coregonus clupeaformis]|uniref:trace amine-associated receptor 13c-like n=1 Tax=Coregonus clupeaformis TaxID=59861 RepID=UPI001E1C3433